jgi:ABC-type Mn2+/Zn2+ transport system ATPase subunit
MESTTTQAFPSTVDVVLQSPVSNTFRCKMACDSLDIDIHKKSVHHLHIAGISLPPKWNIGLIYGASGSGKTTMVKHLFGENIFDSPLNEDEPIINQLPAHLSYEECAAILSGIGLNSVPCWVRPVKTLSNGQRARAEAALLMVQDREIVFIDEWTSVVDRTVAKAMSHCVQKFARKHNKKIVLLSCHYDILEWLIPDWLIDCNEQKFHTRQNENFFFQPRDTLRFDIRAIGRESWRYFSKYHYLSERLPGGKIYLYGLFHGDKQIGFQCFANYTPTRAGTRPIYHSNRTVIHPDYQGLGLGIQLINKSSALHLKQHPHHKIMAKFSAVPVYKAMIKQKEWKFIKAMRTMGELKIGGNMLRRDGFREGGIKTYHFEYVGKTSPKVEISTGETSTNG